MAPLRCPVKSRCTTPPDRGGTLRHEQDFHSAPYQRPTTRAAEGLSRWRWTVAEIERMAEDGYFHEHERFELVGGEIVPMSPEGRRHEIIRGALAFRFTKLAPDGIFVVAEPQLNLDDDTYLNLDILVHPTVIPTPDVRGGDALLVVEVADTSLRYDLNTKGADLCRIRRPRILGHQCEHAHHDGPPATLPQSLGLCGRSCAG
jgi:hypothetical protein